MSIVYAHPPIKSEDEPFVVLINNFVERIVRAAYPGAHLVEFFTWMRYLPEWMAKWKERRCSGIDMILLSLLACTMMYRSVWYVFDRYQRILLNEHFRRGRRPAMNVQASRHIWLNKAIDMVWIARSLPSWRPLTSTIPIDALVLMSLYSPR
jgi:hypothetical protein